MSKRILYYSALALCIAVFVFAGYRLASYYITSYQEEDLYKDLSQSVLEAEKEGKDNANIQVDESDTAAPMYAESGRLYRYEDLYQQNNHLVGWISIPGTKSSYPVMQTPNNEEYYLRKNFYKKYAYGGTPFLDKDSDLEDPASRIIVYGHNLKSGGIFHPLMQYTKRSFWEAYPTFRFDTLYEERTYRIVAVVQLDLMDPDHFTYYAYDRYSSSAAFQGFLEEAREAALYDTGVTAEYGQQIMILSTCSYHVSGDGGRLAIIAVQEPAQQTTAQ